MKIKVIKLSKGIIEGKISGEKPLVSIGNGQKVSMQIIQDLYNQITGKKERLLKHYQIKHRTALQDLQLLNDKIYQTCEQYEVVSENCNVTVYLVNDCKQTFSSFEKFEMYDQTSLSSTENIRLQYNLLIVPTKTNSPQSYKIEIDIHSRAAIKQKYSKERGLSRSIMNLMASQTGVLEIEYIDYIIAKTLHDTIDTWFEGLNQSKENKYLNFLQDNSHHVPLVTCYLSALFICAYFFNQTESWLTTQSSPVELFKISLVAFVSVFIVSGIGRRLGAEIGQAIEKIEPLSFLKLTRGDEKAISELEESNNQNKRKSILNIFFTIVLNLLSAWLAYRIGIGIQPFPADLIIIP